MRLIRKIWKEKNKSTFAWIGEEDVQHARVAEHFSNTVKRGGWGIGRWRIQINNRRPNSKTRNDDKRTFLEKADENYYKCVSRLMVGSPKVFAATSDGTPRTKRRAYKRCRKWHQFDIGNSRLNVEI